MKKAKTKRRRRRLQRAEMRHLGAEPGMVAAPENASPTKMTLYGYGPDSYETAPLEDLAQLAAWRNRFPMVWLRVGGLKDTARLEALADLIGLHRLALEDVLNPHHHPKVEHFDGGVFVVMRVPCWAPPDKVEGQQNEANAAAAPDATSVELTETSTLSLFAKDGLLVSFHEDEQVTVLRFVVERLTKSRLRMRRSGSDYLAYAVCDAAIDTYFPVVDKLGEGLELLDQQLLADPRGDAGAARRIRHNLMGLRRVLLPLQEVLGALLSDDSGWLKSTTRPYLRDCVDHLSRLLSLLDSYREFSRELTEAHMTALAQHTAEVSKVLTIIATVFIPLTFIAGLYGMNFDQKHPYNMPELRSPYGYVAVLGVMAVLAISLVLFFRRKGWLGRRKASAGPEQPSS